MSPRKQCDSLHNTPRLTTHHSVTHHRRSGQHQTSGHFVVQNGDGCHGDGAEHGALGVLGSQQNGEGLVPLHVTVVQDVHGELHLSYTCAT